MAEKKSGGEVRTFKNACKLYIEASELARDLGHQVDEFRERHNPINRIVLGIR